MSIYDSPSSKFLIFFIFENIFNVIDILYAFYFNLRILYPCVLYILSIIIMEV